LLKPASLPPASAARLGRDVKTTFTGKGDTGLQLLSTFQPSLKDTLTSALANAEVTLDSGIKVYALRVKAALFGHNVPRQPLPVPDHQPTVYTLSDPPTIKNTWGQLFDANANLDALAALDAIYDQIKPG